MFLIELTAPEVKCLDRAVPVVIPVAALEQHGGHLPVFTDSLLLGEVIRRAAETLGDEALFAPLQWLGNSHHHLDYGGTVSASPRTYLDLLRDLAQSFLHQGFTRLIFVNGHGGNDVPGRQAIFELRQEYRMRTDLLFIFGTYWLLGARPKERLPGLEQSQMGHACEWETSMILRIRPELVRSYQGLVPVPFGNAFEPAYRGWVTQDRSAPGHIGAPHLASAEKGEALFGFFTEDVVELIRRVARWDGKSWEG